MPSTRGLRPADLRVRDAWFEGARHVLNRILDGLIAVDKLDELVLQHLLGLRHHVLNRILADRADPQAVVGEIEAIWDEAHRRESQRPRKKFYLDT